MLWRCRHRTIDLTRPVVMGILNVTPDSFSDGGRYAALDAALERAARKSWRRARPSSMWAVSRPGPGAGAVEASLEIARVVPVIEGIAAASMWRFPSIPRNPAVMTAAVAAGACIINDVYALREPRRARSRSRELKRACV